MKDRINNGANLLENHVFKFDFLNDDFSNLPESLQVVINDEEKRKKLLIYINPPYAEAASTKTIVSGINKNKTHVAVTNKVYEEYKNKIGIAGRELFIQFLTRIYDKIPGCKIAQFSKLKTLQSPNFKLFRQYFQADLLKLFITPAYTFDNVKGKFPIGFFIWDTDKQIEFKRISGDIYDKDAKKIGIKKFINIDNKLSINDWIISTRKRKYEYNIGYLACYGADFQHTKNTFIVNSKENLKSPRGSVISEQNLKEVSVYFAVRKSISPSWLNDRDQFLWPDSSWIDDIEFQNNCLIFTIFNTSIKSSLGINHWIPFSESEVNSPEIFSSNFMYKYINGILKANDLSLIDTSSNFPTKKLVFSNKAINVINSARNLWKYYFSNNNIINHNASLYDLRLYFQGIDKTTNRLNITSSNSTYNSLLLDLRNNINSLTLDIIPKIYEHKFLVL